MKAEDGIRAAKESRGLGDVDKGQGLLTRRDRQEATCEGLDDLSIKTDKLRIKGNRIGTICKFNRDFVDIPSARDQTFRKRRG